MGQFGRWPGVEAPVISCAAFQSYGEKVFREPRGSPALPISSYESAADALIGIDAGPGGPARTRGSAPRFINSELFISERDHGIDSRGAARGNVAGNRRDHDQNQ